MVEELWCFGGFHGRNQQCINKIASRFNSDHLHTIFIFFLLDLLTARIKYTYNTMQKFISFQIYNMTAQTIPSMRSLLVRRDLSPASLGLSNPCGYVYNDKPLSKYWRTDYKMNCNLHGPANSHQDRGYQVPWGVPDRVAWKQNPISQPSFHRRHYIQDRMH